MCLSLYRPICVGHGRKPLRPVFSCRGSNINDYFLMTWQYKIDMDPVVQSIVSLTISLRHKFVKQISAKVTNTLLFFVEKM